MPTDRGLIDQQLQALGERSRWWDQRELRDLPSVLDPDERILAVARGKIARGRWLRRSWLIVVTDRRLLCLRSGDKTSWRQREVTADEISRVSLRIRPLHGRVIVIAGGHKHRLAVPRADSYKIHAALASLGSSTEKAQSQFGPTRIVHRMLDHMFALPAVALGPDPNTTRTRADDPAIDERLQGLEQELQELREQVRFLEQLLRERQAISGESQVPS